MRDALNYFENTCIDTCIHTHAQTYISKVEYINLVFEEYDILK